MKKKVLILLIVLLISTTGCSKRLLCTKETKQGGMDILEEFMVNYKNDTVDTIQIELKATVEEKEKENIDTIKKNLKESLKDYENMKGVTIQTGSKDNIARVHLYMKLSKMSAKDKKKLNFVNMKENYDQLKKTMEKNKYHCN